MLEITDDVPNARLLGARIALSRPIRANAGPVLSPVPRRSKYILTHDALVARLGPTGFEREGRIVDEQGKTVGRRHIGWRWPCDCRAFARPENDYLWVPCGQHQP